MKNSLPQILGTFVEQQRRLEQRVIFVSGAQGSGKTTSAQMIANSHSDVAVLSLDDFYLPKSDRLKLAERISPLFATRGPPGTHDIRLLNKTIIDLIQSSKDDEVRIPIFDKIIDDRCNPSEWHFLKGGPEIIIVEGWLMGVNPKISSLSSSPLNAVEAMDKDGAWRKYQEEQLASEYASLWDISNSYFHIIAPAFDAVKIWRAQQEETTLGLPSGTLSAKQHKWVNDFIMYYERLTQRMLNKNVRAGLSVPIDMSRTPL